jgi:hypothetical protein
MYRVSSLIDSEQQLPKPRSARQNSPRRKSTKKRAARMTERSMERISRTMRRMLVRKMRMRM